MAGDWIKMRAGLLSHPKVIGMVNYLERQGAFFNFICQDDVTGGELGGYDPDPKIVTEFVTRTALRYVTVSGLLSLWSSVRLNSKGGVLAGLDITDLDEMAGIPCFGLALESVGWATYDEESQTVSLPNFTEWNEAPVKAPAKTNAERQQAFRERHKIDVTKSNDSNDRVEKSREEKSIEAKASCSEAASPQSLPFAFTFPTRGKVRQWGLTLAKLEEYRESFPGMNLEGEIQKALQWCRDNTGKQKTASGMPAFLGRWLAKAADRGHVSNGKPEPTGPRLPTEDEIRRWNPYSPTGLNDE